MANRLLSIPPGSVPQFDELYIISDLHLGGPSGFQIFNSGAELARLIVHLRTQSPEKRVALLINGDFVDFLAERPAVHFDPAGAIGKLNRIAKEDPAFVPVFEELKNFAATENRYLIINLGNHDLELALPWVRANLLEMLSDGNEAVCGRINLAFDGTGFLCRVGNATVLCVHGNEVDAWNVADYETIRRFGREVIQGRPVDSWIPNAGSQLVIDVMNHIKETYPFVDLLKPEKEAVLPTLLALAPEMHDKLFAIAATMTRLVWDKFKRATGFLGSEEEEEYLAGRTVALADMLPATRPSFRAVSGNGNPEFDRLKYAEALLDETEERLNRSVNPLSLVGGDQRGEFLGVTAAVIKYFRGEDTCEVLREALEKLRQDRTFDPKIEDDTYKSLDEQIGDGADFLVAGHTHLARALQRKRGHGWYFNSGTWARLIKLEKHVLEDKDQFRNAFNAFKQGTIEALDSFPNLVMRHLTVVAIWSDGLSTHGELRRVSLDMAAPILPADPTYRFTKS
jgi:UDP-2,3-diacylglucosamine pyrophosphatase LpxH